MAATEAPPVAKRARPRLFTGTFVLVCAGWFFVYAHWSLMTPVLPLYIRENGGTALLVGFVSAAFSATAFLLRPIMGRMVDAWSARGTLAISGLVLGLASLVYLVYHVVLLLVIRTIHGTAWGGYNTAGPVVLSRNVPQERRGEAVGYLWASQGVASAVVPATSLWLLGIIGYQGVFLMCSAAGFAAMAAAMAIRPQPRQQVAATRESFWGSLFERSAFLSSALEFLTNVCQPAAMIFIPLHALILGITPETLAFYYLGVGLITMLGRGWFGGWSDRVGRERVIAAGSASMVVSMVVLSQASGIVVLCIGGLLYGLGSACAKPAIMAMAIDRARPDRRGAALATYSMGFQLAQGGGAVLSGLLIETLGYPSMYLLVALSPLASLLVAANYRGRREHS